MAVVSGLVTISGSPADSYHLVQSVPVPAPPPTPTAPPAGWSLVEPPAQPAATAEAPAQAEQPVQAALPAQAPGSRPSTASRRGSAAAPPPPAVAAPQAALPPPPRRRRPPTLGPRIPVRLPQLTEGLRVAVVVAVAVVGFSLGLEVVRRRQRRHVAEQQERTAEVERRRREQQDREGEQQRREAQQQLERRCQRERMGRPATAAVVDGAVLGGHQNAGWMGSESTAFVW